MIFKNWYSPLLIQIDVPEEKREVSIDEGLTWCQENGELPHVETSAKEATNVEDAFVMAVKAWSSLEAKQERLYTTDTVDLSSHETKGTAKSSCCSGSKSDSEASGLWADEGLLSSVECYQTKVSVVVVMLNERKLRLRQTIITERFVLKSLLFFILQ